MDAAMNDVEFATKGTKFAKAKSCFLRSLWLKDRSNTICGLSNDN